MESCETEPLNNLGPPGAVGELRELGRHKSLPNLPSKQTPETGAFWPKLGFFVQPDDARCLAQSWSNSIFDSYHALRAILERHEATIQKRWTKKSKSQRQAILTKAWPNMATGHRPDFAAYNASLGQWDLDRSNRTKWRDPFMWPYINLQDLSEPKTLLLLLNARGRHEPCDFAAVDHEAMNLGTTLNAIVLIYVKPHQIMVLNGATVPDEYGKLLLLDKDPDALEKQYTTMEGFTILEAQKKLLAFLVSCCKQILHDMPFETMISDAFPIKPEPQLKAENFDSLASMMAEAPYRVPAQIDFDRIEALLSAKTSAAEDHLLALREDPGYFSETLWELAEHWPGNIKDKFGQTEPELNIAQGSLTFWASVTCRMLLYGCGAPRTFSDLLRQAQELRVLQTKHSAAISPSEDLPKEYLRAILMFCYCLTLAADASLDLLGRYGRASPSLRKFYLREPQKGDMPGTSNVVHSDAKKTKVERELVASLNTLCGTGEDCHYKRLPDVMDDLDRLSNSNSKAKELISPFVARIIGEVCVISQCHRQLEIYPWARGFVAAMKKYGVGIEKEIKIKNERWNSWHEDLQDLRCTTNALEIGNAPQGKYAYPIHKRRTKENVEILRRSEEGLDDFWSCVDMEMFMYTGEDSDLDAQSQLKKSQTIQRTPEWAEPIKQPGTTEMVQAVNTTSDALHKPMSTLYIGFSPEEPNKYHKKTQKTKLKTSGTANSPSSPTSKEPSEDPSSPEPQPTFEIDARALKVFRTLFHDPSATATPGEVRWQDFLHAMGSVGFAAEKLYGSVWSFRPAALNVNRGILLHEPHPLSKMDYHIARQHGRRLNRAYGWDGDMFVLKKK
ncbi:hypothetical protein N8I77_009448 [Diaporthe amygdali]|uniref:Uncharacterized protein n=1 Tax=Phomopsis amygdali TaxID=1214568 RepID=A0AAD9SA61_PHOAM|nr:hypothetical protein N8I77_009448 [Diaporthe amygdali]